MVVLTSPHSKTKAGNHLRLPASSHSFIIILYTTLLFVHRYPNNSLYFILDVFPLHSLLSPNHSQTTASPLMPLGSICFATGIAHSELNNYTSPSLITTSNRHLTTHRQKQPPPKKLPLYHSNSNLSISSSINGLPTWTSINVKGSLPALIAW